MSLMISLSTVVGALVVVNDFDVRASDSGAWNVTVFFVLVVDTDSSMDIIVSSSSSSDCILLFKISRGDFFGHPRGLLSDVTLAVDEMVFVTFSIIVMV